MSHETLSHYVRSRLDRATALAVLARRPGPIPRSVLEFQAGRGLRPTGRIDAITLDALRFAPSHRPNRAPPAPARKPVASVLGPLRDVFVALGALPSPGPACTLDVIEALQAFEIARDLPVDGDLGYEDCLALGEMLTRAGAQPDALVTCMLAVDPALVGRARAWPRLARGDQRSFAVAFCQHRLNASGYGLVEVDGELGEETERQVVALQMGAGLIADGVVEDETWERLLFGFEPLTPGDQGEAVQILQLRLAELGHGELQGTGYFGDRTAASLGSFQRENGLPVRPVIDAETWRNLFLASSALTPPEIVSVLAIDLAQEAERQIARLPEAARASVRAVLEVAIASYGVREKPAGSHRGPEVDALVGTRGWAWSALAVSQWLYRGLGARTWAETPFGMELASANSIRALAAAQERFLDPEDVPPGAILIQDQSGESAGRPDLPFERGHAGLVLADLGDGSVQALEGDCQHAVRVVRRQKDEVVGFVRWWG